MQATFLLAGWTKAEPRTHVVRLVDSSKVLAVKETLQPLTSYHAFSVQPSKPQVLRVSGVRPRQSCCVECHLPVLEAPWQPCKDEPCTRTRSFIVRCRCMRGYRRTAFRRLCNTVHEML